jgi:lysophospholipase L1-like esterase
MPLERLPSNQPTFNPASHSVRDFFDGTMLHGVMIPPTPFSLSFLKRALRLASRTLPVFGLALGAAETPAPKSLVVAPNSVWVMAGDSITAQRQHSNYIEAFYRTRFPQLNLQFRNSGIGGNTTASVLARFGYDVADWKPTVVSIELGMNDVGSGDDPRRYIDGMRLLIKKIREIPAVPVLISSSPVNDGSATNAWQSDRCRRIQPYTEALVKLGNEENVIVIDQYTPLLNRWAENKLRTDFGRLKAQSMALQKSVIKESEPGFKEFEAFLQKWNGSANARELGGDPVHPGPVGQLTMAAVILQKLGAPKEVSAATLDAKGTVARTSGCKIESVESAGGQLKFRRVDESMPWPIPAQARDALVVMPEIADLSRYMLSETGLPDGNYQVLMDDAVAAEASANQLASGLNLSTANAGPFVTRSNEIHNLINTLQGPLNNRWREASKTRDAQGLAAAAKEIAATEATLAEACRPKPILFTIKKVK